MISALNLTDSQQFINSSNTTVVNCCDYYEKGRGYIFSDCNTNLGVIVNPNLVGDARDMYYKNITRSENATANQN